MADRIDDWELSAAIKRVHSGVVAISVHAYDYDPCPRLAAYAMTGVPVRGRYGDRLRVWLVGDRHMLVALHRAEMALSAHTSCAKT